MLTLAAALAGPAAAIFNKLCNMVAPGGDVAGGLERADPHVCRSAVIAAAGGADRITQALYHRYDDDIVYFITAFVATILGYGICRARYWAL